MDFILNEQQEMLRSSAHQFLGDKCPIAFVRQMAADERGYSQEIWEEIANLGWLGLIFPEEYGGIDLDFLDLVILLEEMGRFCFPSPFISTVICGGLPVLWAGTEEQKKELLNKLASGKLLMTLAYTEPGTHYGSTINTRATEDKGNYIINGTKLFVPDANVADYLICAARTKGDVSDEQGITLFLVDRQSAGVEITGLKTTAEDKQCEVTFNQVKVPESNMLGECNQGWDLLQRVMEYAAVAKCAEMVGGAKQVLDMSVDYSKERVQFGHPIGSFQAVQHRCADMFINIDGMKFITYEAAWRLSQGLPSTKEVSMAKTWVSDAYQKVVRNAHQVHGGTGFTEDHDLPVYFKRAQTAKILFGDASYHRKIVASQLKL